MANSDSGKGSVVMDWPHEVLDMPTEAPTPPTGSGPWFAVLRAIYNLQKDRYDHYTVVGADPSQNYHYLASNQVMPLMATSPGITDLHGPRHRLGFFNGEGWTDLWSCRGAAGAGVLQWSGSHYELLGPVTNTDASIGANLCYPKDAPQGKPLTAYARVEYSQALANAAWKDSREWGALAPGHLSFAVQNALAPGSSADSEVSLSQPVNPVRVK